MSNEVKVSGVLVFHGAEKMVRYEAYAALAAEVEALRADAERLDWMERAVLAPKGPDMPRGAPWCADYDVTICAPGNHGAADQEAILLTVGDVDHKGFIETTGRTIRAAIDNARK